VSNGGFAHRLRGWQADPHCEDCGVETLEPRPGGKQTPSDRDCCLKSEPLPQPSKRVVDRQTLGLDRVAIYAWLTWFDPCL
jgi:hypothetical protein